MRQYFTYVNPFFYDAHHPVEYNVQNNIGELWNQIEKDFCVINGSSLNDPRELGYVEIPEDVNGMFEFPAHPGHLHPVQNGIDLILKMFPHDLETVEEAKEKVERWTGRTDITIDGDKVIIPLIDPPI